MKIKFRQGLVLSEVNANGQPNYLTFDPNVGVTLRTGNRSTAFTVADGTKNYTIDFYRDVLAWPSVLFDGVSQAWMYIDLNRATSARSYGITTAAPVYNHVAPQSPVDGQHWFDTSKSIMKVYSSLISSWITVIRVFAGQYLNAVVTPYPFGSQVGLTGVTAVTGTIFVDGFGIAIKDSRGNFVTTEDTLLVSGAPSYAAKIESNVSIAEAKEPIPAFHAVMYDENDKILLAGYANTGSSAIGIVTEAADTGEPVNVVLQGQIQNLEWNWNGPNITLWVSSSGELVPDDPYLTAGSNIQRQPPVARSINATTIIFNPGLVNMIGDRGPTGGKGDKGDKGDKGETANAVNASVTTKGVSKLSVAPASPTNPIAVGINDPILIEPRVPLAHVHPATQITVTPFGDFTDLNVQQALQHLDSGSTSLNSSIANLSSTTDPVKGSGMIGHNDALDYPVGTVGEKIKQLPTSPGVTAAAQAVVNTHNDSAAAHPALSAFVTEEADRAEAAADAASLASGVYDTTAAGIAATTPGKYFSVPSADAVESLILYKNNAGVAQEIKTYPSSEAVLEVTSRVGGLDSTTVAMQVEDDNNFVLMKVLGNGDLDLLKSQINNVANGLQISNKAGAALAKFETNQSTISGMVLEPTTAPGLMIIDAHGFILPGGNFSTLSHSELDPIPSEPTPMALALNQQQRTDHMHIIGYGQSLSRGAYATPVISITQPYNNLMLASGTKTRANESGYDASAYVPLVEDVKGNDGETPVTALCNGLVRRAVSDGELATDWVMIGSSPGIGGQSVEALGPGGLGYYEKTIQLIKDSAALSASLGKSYSVWAYCWDQGEGNYSTTGSGATATKSAYQYAQLQLELFDGMSREIAQITGQKFRPYLFTYQVGAHRKYGRDSLPIALAQWRASRVRPDVVVAVPVYIFPTYTDLLHLTNEASWLLGEYRSRAMYETMVRRNEKWRPLEPISVDWQAGFIDIKFHVPRGQLVLDTALAAATPNFGFDIREAGNVVLDLINSVTITSHDTVRLTLSRETATDALISYARGRMGDPAASGPVTGPRGNLRDTHGLFDTAVSPLGNTFALHNPCVMFEYNRKTGF